MDVSIVVPARNEEAMIGRVIDALRRLQPAVAEIIVVDDGSSDRTAQIAREAGATVVDHPVSRGYGASIKSGMLAARTTLVVTVDGDGQHRASDVPKLLASAHHYDLVSGERAHWLHSTTWRLPGKWLLTRLGSYLVKRQIPDLNCGLRVYRREVILRYLHLCSDAYSFTATSVLLFLSRGDRVAFVPVEVTPASSQGRVTVRTGLDTLVLLLRMATLLDPLRVFLPISSIVFGLGVLWGVPYALAGRGVSVGALLFLLTGIVLFAVGLLSDQISQLRQERLDLQRDQAAREVKEKETVPW